MQLYTLKLFIFPKIIFGKIDKAKKVMFKYILSNW